MSLVTAPAKFFNSALKHLSASGVSVPDHEENYTRLVLNRPVHIVDTQNKLKALAKDGYDGLRLAEEMAKAYAESLMSLYAGECLAFAFKDYTRKNIDAWFDKHCDAIGCPFRFTESSTYGAGGYLKHTFYRSFVLFYQDEGKDRNRVTETGARFGYSSTLAAFRQNPEETIASLVKKVEDIEAAISKAPELLKIHRGTLTALENARKEYDKGLKESLDGVYFGSLSLPR